MQESYLIGIAGGSGSGKTTLSEALQRRFPDDVEIVHYDNYYKNLSHLPMEERLAHNFDEPDAFNYNQLVEHLAMLRRGETVVQEIYSFLIYEFTGEFRTITPRPVIIVEGMYPLLYPELRELYNLMVFVDADDDLRLLRRMRRLNFGRNKPITEYDFGQYLNFVRPSYKQFIEPSKQFAHIVVQSEGSLDPAVEVLSGAIESVLRR